MTLEEDTSEKIRRNLLVASSAVLAVHFFDLPFHLLLDKFLSSSTQQLSVPPLKLWIFLLIVLSYLLMRYRFSDAWHSLASLVLEPLAELRKQRIENLLRNAIDQFSRNRLDSALFNNGLPKIDAKYSKIISEKLGQPVYHLLRFTISDYGYSRKTPWHGVTTLQIEADVSDELYFHDSQVGIKYSVPRSQVLIIEAYSRLVASFYTKQIVIGGIPLLLAAFAFLVCLINLARWS